MVQHASPSRQAAAIEATLAKAMAAFRDGRPGEAEGLAGGVLGKDPGHVAAAWILGQVLLAEGRAADAIQPLERAARLNPSPATETLLGRALAEVGRDKKALEHLNRAVALQPPFEMAFLELGDRLRKLGRFEEGRRALEAGLAEFPASAMLRMALGYQNLACNHEQDRELFAKVLAGDPGRHDARVALANVAVLEGDWAGAADFYRQALAQRPGDPLILVELGRCLLELGSRAEGEAILKQAAGGSQAAAGLAIAALAASAKGRLFLRPSAARQFLIA